MFDATIARTGSLRLIAWAAVLLVTPAIAPGQGAVQGDEFTQPGDLLSAFVWNERTRRLQGKQFYVERLRSNELNFVDPDEWRDEGDGVVSCVGNCLVFKVDSLYDENGALLAVQTRLLNSLEVSVLAGATPGSDLMSAYGRGMMAFQLEFNQAVTGTRDPTGNIQRVNAFSDTGDPSVLSDSVPPPWMDPFAMMYAGGAMINDASKALRGAEESLAQSADLARDEADAQASVVSQLERSGEEDVGGRRTIRYTTDGLDRTVEVTDGRFDIERASLWIDPEDLVLVKHRWEGTATADGQSREFFIEVVNSDFRNPPGCGEMYEPYRRVQRMGGILDDSQMAEMEKAKEQLEEFERQMAELPAEQRAMAERMMGSRMDAVRNMADGGTIEHVTEVEEILCDPDLKALFGVGIEDAVPDEQLARIQRHLMTLGYQPGNTRGELDDATRSAISEFQTDQGLTVTGQPSAELEELLAAEVGDE